MLLGASDSLLQFADRFHLLPLVFLFFFLGFLDALTTAATITFRRLAEIVQIYYDFRAQCANSKARFLQALMKGP